MRYLLDEQLHETSAVAVNAMGGPSAGDDEFRHILNHRDHGTPDEDIPPLCREHGYDVLVTANFKDFGARKVYYQSLLSEGIHVLVLRPGKGRFDVPEQVGLLSRHYRRVQALFEEAEGPTLVRATPSDARARSLADLIEEFEGGRTRRLP